MVLSARVVGRLHYCSNARRNAAYGSIRILNLLAREIRILFFHATVRHAEVNFLGHSYEQAGLHDSGYQGYRLVDLAPIG